MDEQKNTNQEQGNMSQNKIEPVLKADSKDFDENKLWAILAYILFFLPMIFAKDSKFANYHAKQGLVLFIAGLLINVVGGIIPILGWFIILPLGNILVIILAIIGIINAAKAEMKQLPLIGSFAKSFKF